jgi:uncharacterized protein
VLLSATYPADLTRMSNRIHFQLLYLTSAPVPGWTFSKCPAERKAVAVVRHGKTSLLNRFGLLLTHKRTFMQQQTLPPVVIEERIQTIDIIRGFALFGILTIGFTVDNGGNAPWFGRTGVGDQIVFWTFRFFVDDKFQNIYCFLFGLGFAILIQRANARNTLFWPVYIWRMIILFLIGSAQFIFINYRTVLADYAVMGLLLLVFWNLPRKFLFPFIIVCAIFPWIKNTVIEMKKENIISNSAKNVKVDSMTLKQYTGIYMINQDSWIAIQRENDSLTLKIGSRKNKLTSLSQTDFLEPNNVLHRFSKDHSGEIKDHVYAFGNIIVLKKSGIDIPTGLKKMDGENAFWNRYSDTMTYNDHVILNTREVWLGVKHLVWRGWFVRNYLLDTYKMGIILTLFLIGLYAGKRKLFYDIESNKRFFTTARFWGLLIGSTLIAIVLAKDLLQYIYGDKFPKLSYLQNSLIGEAWKLGAIFMAIGIVAWLTLLVNKEKWRRRLGFMSYVGRMGLTNYIVQSAAWTLIFSNMGLNLVGKIGGFYGFLIAIPVCSLIVLSSRWWFKYFRMGPVEWLWRSLTYLKFQSIRL